MEFFEEKLQKRRFWHLFEKDSAADGGYVIAGVYCLFAVHSIGQSIQENWANAHETCESL